MTSPLKKIFISAYDCDPTKGSDHGVACQWVFNLAESNNYVVVATRREHQAGISSWLKSNPHLRSHLEFVYLDYPDVAQKLHFLFRGIDHYIYYYYWQIKLRKIAITLHQTHHFDIIQHVSWVNVRLPSFLGGICPRFIFGPVAGGEQAPLALWRGYGPLQWLQDSARTLWSATVKFDPLLRRTFSQADTIIVTSECTKLLIPKKFHHKAVIQLAIGVEPERILREKRTLPDPRKSEIKILYVGRFLDWKGISHIGLPAFQQFLRSYPTARLTLVGSGRDEARWLRQINSLKLNNQVDVIGWIEREKLNDIYDDHHLLLFPSLHDSGGMVILEAMARGLPVVCLDLGGPKVIVDARCGVVIESARKTVAQVAADLAQGMVDLVANEEKYRELSTGALQRARELSWQAIVQHACNTLEFGPPPAEKESANSPAIAGTRTSRPPTI